MKLLITLLSIHFALVGSIAGGQTPEPCTIDTVAGGGPPSIPEGIPAVEAELIFPGDPVIAADGSLYFSESGLHVVQRVRPDGVIETVAGTGKAGFSGDGGPARMARLNTPATLALASDGTLYIFDFNNNRIRKVTPGGTITTVAGNGERAFSGDGGPAIEASLGLVQNIAVDTAGSLYLAERAYHRIRKITPDGRIDTVVGSGPAFENEGAFAGDGGPATEARLNLPFDVEVDAAGVLYVADNGNVRVRAVDRQGIIRTVVGAGVPGFTPDGEPAEGALIRRPVDMELDQQGRLFFGDSRRIRYIDGEGNLATDLEQFALLFARAEDGTFFYTNGIQILWRARLGEEPEIYAGVGSSISAGDGGPATDARLARLTGVGIGPDSEIYLTDGILHRVRVVTPDGVMRSFAGTGERGFSGDGGPAVAATLQDPRDVAVDREGNVYISDHLNKRVRRVDPSGTIATFAGNGNGSCVNLICQDNVPATEAEVMDPRQIAVDSQGSVYVIDRQRRRSPERWVRKITPDGIIQTVPTRGASGGPRGNALAIAVDHQDHLIISTASFSLRAHWRLSPEGELSPLPGANGFIPGSVGVAADALGNTYFVERSDFHQVRRLTPDALANTIVGPSPPESGFAGDGGPARSALLNSPADLEVDADGNLYIADGGNVRVRRVLEAAGCPVIVQPEIAVGGVRHAAGAAGGVAPGALFSVFGRRLGPEEGEVSRFDDGGRLPTSLGGTRVLVDGIPAPLLFVSSGQINAIVPYEVEVGVEKTETGGERYTRFSSVQVEYHGVLSEGSPELVRKALPRIFASDGSGFGQAAALNQDGTLNGPLNPAAPGSVIVFFATGEGLTTPAGVDGKINTEPLPRPVLDVAVEIDGEPAKVLYAGGAPGMVAGVMQVNARVPENLRQLGAVSVVLQVGDEKSSRQVTVVVGF